jgi:hypothetical protein
MVTPGMESRHNVRMYRTLLSLKSIFEKQNPDSAEIDVVSVTEIAAMIKELIRD